MSDDPNKPPKRKTIQVVCSRCGRKHGIYEGDPPPRDWLVTERETVCRWCLQKKPKITD